jgi:hypothetical protein
VIKQNLEHGYITPDANFQVVSVRVHDVETGVGLAEVRTREAPYDVLNGDKKVVGHVDARENFLDLSMVQQEAGEWVIANQFDLMGDP